MYNEAVVLDRTMSELIIACEELSDRYDFEVLIVDDGSTDDTLERAMKFAAEHDQIHVLSHRVNFELGQALRYAFGQSNGDYVVTFDADLTYDTSHIGRMLDAIVETGARIVIASPYMPGGETRGIPFTRRVLSRQANRFLSFFNQDHLSTITGMVRAYDGPFIRTLDLKAVGGDINTEIIQKAQILRARMVEIPAVLDWTSVPVERLTSQRFNSRLYWNTAKQLASGFLFRPFLAFILPGLLLLGGAAGFGGWIAFDTIERADRLRSLMDALHQSWHSMPGTFFAFGLCLLLGMQFVLLGVVSFQNKRYFDEMFHLNTMVLRQVSDEPVLHRRGTVDPPQSG